MTTWISAFVSTARSLTGQYPIIYTTANWWDTCTAGSTAFGADPMWVAAYGFASPPLPAGWTSWTYWQYTSSGTVPGVDSAGTTDLDVFDMSLVGLIDPGGQASRAGAKVALGVASLDTAGRQPLTWTAAGLPPGLAITSVGTITGVVGGPTATYRVTVTARNPAGAAARRDLQLAGDRPAGFRPRACSRPSARSRYRPPAAAAARVAAARIRARRSAFAARSVRASTTRRPVPDTAFASSPGRATSVYGTPKAAARCSSEAPCGVPKTRSNTPGKTGLLESLEDPAAVVVDHDHAQVGPRLPRADRQPGRVVQQR